MSHPTASELLAAVQLFLKEAEGELRGRLAFHAKVAGNALGIVIRELEGRPDEVEKQAFGPFGSVEAACAFVPPPFLGREVTEEPGHTMAEYCKRKAGRP